MFENVDINIIAISIIILCIFIIINFVLLILSYKRVNKYKKMYEKTLSKFNSKKNIHDEFERLYDRLNEVEYKSEETLKNTMELYEKMRSNIQKVGFVKYNAYDDTDNKLSFALALLDDNSNGILINHIYSKYGSNIYSKLVTLGKVEERISEEEATALKIAEEDKEFKIRQAVEKEQIKAKNKHKTI